MSIGSGVCSQGWSKFPLFLYLEPWLMQQVWATAQPVTIGTRQCLDQQYHHWAWPRMTSFSPRINSQCVRVRACVVCCTGRGFKSHAYTHSVQEGHHVFLNLETMKFYCLPDNYQIIDQSLEDIVVSSLCLSVSVSVSLSVCLLSSPANICSQRFMRGVP